jgi:hypothetical protein
MSHGRRGASSRAYEYGVHIVPSCCSRIVQCDTSQWPSPRALRPSQGLKAWDRSHRSLRNPNHFRLTFRVIYPVHDQTSQFRARIFSAASGGTIDPSVPDAGDRKILEAARSALGPNLSHAVPAARYWIGHRAAA